MIKAEVRYESEHIKALFELEDEKRRPKRIGFFIIVFLICVVYSSIPIMHFILYKNLGNNGTICAIISVFLWIAFIRRLVKNRRIIKDMDSFEPVRELRSFSFDDTMFRMICTREGFFLDQQIHYPELVSAVETEKFFFITIEKGKTCIIGKFEITEGSPSELRSLLTEKLGEKFKVKG